MFEIELKNPDEMVIKAKERVVNINVAQSTVSSEVNLRLVILRLSARV